MWLGGTYSVRKFVDVFLQHKIAKQIVMFSGGPIQLDHTAGYSAEQWYDWIITRLRDQTTYGSSYGGSYGSSYGSASGRWR